MVEVLFIQEVFYEYMGIMYLSAMLNKSNISTDLIIERNFQKILRHISHSKPKLVCFSVMSGIHKFPIEVSKKIKEHFPDTKIIAGGPHPTFFPEYIKEGNFDAICRGEADLVIRQYYNYVLKKKDVDKVPNIVFKANGKIYENPIMNLIEPLDQLPFPDRGLYDKYNLFKNSSCKAVVVHRGCPFQCSHCYNARLKKIYKEKGKYARFRSPENIIDEIGQIKKKYRSLRILMMGGDILFCDKQWLIKLLNLYAQKIKLPFITQVTGNMVDEEVAELLKKANCKILSFGIESGNERIRKKILKKNISNKKIIETAAILKKYNIKFRTYNILGIPTENMENMLQTIHLNIKIGTDYPWSAIFTPYPGTELFDFTAEHGQIDRDFSFDDLPLSYMEKSILKRSDTYLIDNMHKFFTTVVKFPFLQPLIMKLIRLKPNIIFKIWFGLIYVITMRRCEGRSFFSILSLALKNSKFYISEKKRQ